MLCNNKIAVITTDVLILQLGHIWPRILRALQSQLDGARDDPLSLMDLTISEPNRQTITPESAKKHMPLPISIPSAPVTVDSHLSTSSDPPLSFTTYPEEDRVMSPYLVSSFNPLVSRCHCHLVPRRRLMKSRILCRH